MENRKSYIGCRYSTQGDFTCKNKQQENFANTKRKKDRF